VECKWEKSQLDHNKIIEFLHKIDVVGVSGLLVSMSGFSESAISTAKEYRKQAAILLMDGVETKLLFTNQINFDDLMARKRLHFDQRSDPYHRVSTVPEAA
jgi:hypothetical protein